MKTYDLPDNDNELHDEASSYTNEKADSSAALPGIMLDLSPFGGRLLLPGQARLERDHFSLEIADRCISHRIMLDSRILWTNLNNADATLELGCEFVRPANHIKLALMQLIRENRFKKRQLMVNCRVN